MDARELGYSMSLWTHTRTNYPRPLEGFLLEGFRSESYTRIIDATLWSLARFYLYEEELYRAWGIQAEEHCSAYLYTFDMSARSGCPLVRVEPRTEDEAYIVLGNNESKHPARILKHP